MRPLARLAPALILAACSSPGGADEPAQFEVRRDLEALPQAHRATARALVAAADAVSAGQRERAAAQLLVAAAGCPQPRLAAHLRAAHRTWLTDADLQDLETTLLDLGGRPLVAPFAPAEGPGRVLRAVQVGQVEEHEQDALDHLLANLHRFEDWLGLGGAGQRPARDRLIIARVIARGGEVAPGAMHTRLPRDRARRAEVGSLSVFWRTMLRESWWRTGVAPAAHEVLVPEDAAQVSADAHLRWYATRFGCAQVGPQLDRAHFEGDWGPLAIVKADVLGALARVWLASEEKVDPLEEREAACTLVAMAFRALADARLGEAPAAHERASALELAWLLDQRALELRDGRLVVDVPRTVAAARDLTRELATVAVQRDRGRARALLARGERLPQAVREAVERVVALPREERVPVFR